MAPPKKTGVIVDYEEIVKLVGNDIRQVRQDANRGILDINNLKSVLMYAVRRGGPDLKSEIFTGLSDRSLDSNAVTRNSKKKLEAYRKSRRKEE